ncbi:2202_t:CDS:2, partial [Gigaspora rosea]
VCLSPTYSIHKRSLISRSDFIVSPRNETGLLRISPSASKFLKEDLEALIIVFRPASSEDVVILAIDVKNYPKQYEVPKINVSVLSDPYFKNDCSETMRNINKRKRFNVDDFKGIQDNHVKTFVAKLHDVIRNTMVAKGTDESTTDTLVSDTLIHVADMDVWLFKFR